MKINAASFIINNFRNVFSSHHQPTPVNDPLMEPPSYEDACFQPRPSDARASDIPPPPSYDASSLPSPPTYREAVTTQPDPFPLLSPPSVPTSAPPPPPNSNTIVHPLTQVGVTPPVRSARAVCVSAVVSQPRPVPILPAYLTDVSGVVSCPFCQQVVSSEVKHVPGRAAWVMCLLISLTGLFCGFCLIAFIIPSLQDVHHYCPQCKRLLHVYKRLLHQS